MVGSFCPNLLGLEGWGRESRFDSSNLTGSIPFSAPVLLISDFWPH